MNRLKKLAFRIAVGGGVLTYIAINTIPIVLNNKIRATKHYQEAIRLLTSHPEAVKYLGEPMTPRHIQVTNPDSYGADDEKMWIKVPVTGPKGKGTLFYDFLVDKYNSDAFEFSRVELTVNGLEDYKLIIKK